MRKSLSERRPRQWAVLLALYEGQPGYSRSNAVCSGLVRSALVEAVYRPDHSYESLSLTHSGRLVVEAELERLGAKPAEQPAERDARTPRPVQILTGDQVRAAIRAE